MLHFIDLLIVSLFGLIASGFLYKTTKKLRRGCASICNGCHSACPTKIKQFNPKIIQIQKIS